MRLRELRVSYRPVQDAPAGPRPRLSTPAEAARFLGPLLDAEAVEVCGLLLLNTKHEPIAWHVLSRGTLDSTLVHPREVIKIACLANTAVLIVAHNHPSGDPTATDADIAVARRLQTALTLVGLDLLDAIVIGEGGRYCSQRELGQL